MVQFMNKYNYIQMTLMDGGEYYVYCLDREATGKTSFPLIIIEI